MTRACLLTLSALLAYSAPGEAHALDEYLQATRLAISRDRVVVELDLTPGVSVAAQVFALIDRDEDMRVTPLEIEDYAHRVLRDLSLRVNGHDYPLTLVRAESPSWEEIRDGEGTIRLEAFGRAPLTPGGNRIRYENVHQRGGSGVFLVNVLAPSTRDVAIRTQHRDVLQHAIDVDVDVCTPINTASWWLLPVAGLAAVLIARRGKDRHASAVSPLCPSARTRILALPPERRPEVLPYRHD